MKQILFVDDKPAIGKVLSVYLGKEMSWFISKIPSGP